MGWLGFDSREGQGCFSFVISSIPTLKTTKSPIRLVSVNISPNRSAKLTVHLHVAEVWNSWSFTSRRLVFIDFELLGAEEILVL